MANFFILIPCLLSLWTLESVSGQSYAVRSILHNWGRVAGELSEFENWLCGNSEAIASVTRNLPRSTDELTEKDVNGLICTYNTNAAKVNGAVGDFYSDIANDSSLAIPGYTIWNLFRDFSDNRRDVLTAFNKAAASRQEIEILWVVRNEEVLVDLKEAFLGAQRDLMGLQGYHF